MPAASKRVNRVLHLVDQLELDPAELKALRDELEARQTCEIDLDACKTEQDREFALILKQRIDAVARGDAELVPIGTAMKRAKEEIRRIQTERRRPSR